VEFLPIAIFEGLVMAGLFIACMMPAVSPPDDRVTGGPDPDQRRRPTRRPVGLVGLLADLEPRSPSDATNGSRASSPERHADAVVPGTAQSACSPRRRMPRTITRIVISSSSRSRSCLSQQWRSRSW